MDWKAVRAMIFSELYGAYYNTVAAVLRAAVDHPLGANELHRIIEEHAFGESSLNILPALKEERWQFIRADGTTPLKNPPTMPFTLLQKRWLKAIASDPKIRLFTDQALDFPDVEPLFLPEDILVFDKYGDGDDYENETYIRNFRLILDAIKKKYPLRIVLQNRKGRLAGRVLMPEYLEYSEKDDKFRLIGSGSRFGSTINLGRIVSCKPCDKPCGLSRGKRSPAKPESVVFELVNQRNALERVLLHFAHFQKQAERLENGRYRVTLYYDREDETEIVIRILSFGPMIRVTAPQHFVELIKQRLIDQKSCGH